MEYLDTLLLSNWLEIAVTIHITSSQKNEIQIKDQDGKYLVKG